MDQGDLLVSRYEFKLAAAVYKEALQKADSATTATIQEKLLQCENGQNMLQYGTRPQLVTKKSLAKDEFFLYYTHLGANSWKVTEGGEIVFFPSGADKLVIEKEDESGLLGLYTSDKISGNNWGPLTPLNETLAAGVDAVLPIFSADGKTIYFTAKGLFGMGGYDVYSCKWDESAKEWGAPENIGFPFSSPADDFLFSPTEDGSMALFASNRESSSPDSLIVYVVKYDSTPVKSAVSSAEEAAGIAIFNSDALSGNKAQSGKTEQNSAEKEAVQAYA
ncbi:MAG: PD40 domain-containing protein, partial [Bacteroidales bacterium]|nr:PD40 domain-containing protein [Bacteroidales bacterium]